MIMNIRSDSDSGISVKAPFVVLDASVREERLRWLTLWSRWPEREPVAHPAFGECFAQADERVLCATIESAGGAILFPFILRPLSNLPWTRITDGWDATGPMWGYTGAFRWGLGDDAALDFWRQLELWAKAEGVVSQFTRLSLFPDQVLPFDGPTRLIQPNVVRSLRLTPEELWLDVEHKVRKNVNRARRESVAVAIERGSSSLGHFLDIYADTMARRGASHSHYVSEAFLAHLFDELQENVVLFVARRAGIPISVEIALRSTHHAYSFLGGTREVSFPMRPNDLLKYELFEWAMREGITDVVLGGGPTPEDGIYRYKKSFAPDGIVPFHVGEKIFDNQAYEMLTERRRSYLRNGGVEWEPSPGYFPAYRS